MSLKLRNVYLLTKSSEGTEHWMPPIQYDTRKGLESGHYFLKEERTVLFIPNDRVFRTEEIKS